MNDHSFLAFFFFFAAFSSGLFFISLPRDAAVYTQKQPTTTISTTALASSATVPVRTAARYSAPQPQAAAVHLLLPLLLRRERMLLRLALPGLLFPDVITLKRIHVPVAPSLSFSLRVLYAARWDDVQKEVNFSPLASHICAERPKPARNIGYSPIYFLRAEE